MLMIISDDIKTHTNLRFVLICIDIRINSVTHRHRSVNEERIRSETIIDCYSMYLNEVGQKKKCTGFRYGLNAPNNILEGQCNNYNKFVIYLWKKW